MTERIPAIDGRMKPSARDAVKALGWGSTPKWQTTQYTVVLSRENNHWHIKNLINAKAINE